MTTVASFAPVAAPDARVLVLGSMPGTRSLTAREYYAHRHNAFWPIMAELLGFSAEADYAVRTHALCASRVALWDVLKTCYREGSMDADIRDAVPNDFESFLEAHPAIDAVFFNGAKAEQVWRKRVAPHLPGRLLPRRQTRLPSTSPAYAAMKFEQKLERWRVVAEALGGRRRR